MAPIGGTLIAIGIYNTPSSLWESPWFDFGLCCLVIAAVAAIWALLAHFKRGGSKPSVRGAPGSVTLLGGLVGGRSRLEIESSAETFAKDTTFTGNSTTRVRHMPPGTDAQDE